MSEIGRKLQQFRERSNKTQLKIADDLGITQAHVSRIEKGKSKLSASLVNRISSLIGERINPSNLKTHTLKEKGWAVSYFVMGDEFSGDRIIYNLRSSKNNIYISHVDSEGHNTAAIRASNAYKISFEAIICAFGDSGLLTSSHLLRSLDHTASSLKEDWPVSSSCSIFSLGKNDGLLSYINAGMPDTYIYKAKEKLLNISGGITKVKPVRELASNQQLADTNFIIEKGDIVASFSDGFLEFFKRTSKTDIREYVETFSKTLRGDAEGLTGKILKDMALNEGSIGSSDDISFLIIGRI